MKIQTQTHPERSQLGTLLADFSVAMMTSADAYGALVSRPMAALEMDRHGALWFFTQLDSARNQQLRSINLSFSDKSGAKYVSLSGRGEISLDRAHMERLWTPFARPWFPDGAGSADLALLRFAPESAEFWDAPQNRMVRLFGMAVSIVAGRPIALGQHNTLDNLTAAPSRVSHA